MLDALVAEARERAGLDPAAGVQIVALEQLLASPIEPSRPLLLVPLGVLAGGDAPTTPGSRTAASVAALPGRRGPGGSDRVAVLQRLYPLDHEVTPLARGGDRPRLTIRSLTDAHLEAPLYVAPLPAEAAFGGLWTMAWISHRLRQPDGCPWDREQTHESLRKHLLEEAYEVYDALDHGATPELAGELGDLLLQIVLHAQLAAEEGVFDLTDVNAAIARKIVRRHPHVFGDAVAETAADVTRQWERIKADERAGERTVIEKPRGALDGISSSLPALAASEEMQERAAALGYDWPDVYGILDKVAEELGELAAAGNGVERTEEFGDLLLVMVNVGRRLGIESEAALRAANRKFRSRFQRVERMVAERGVAIRDLDFAGLDELWDAAKAEERGAALTAETEEAAR